MHSSFYIETTGRKRECRKCDKKIEKGEECFVESYHDGMYIRKDNYHLKCAIIFINEVIEKFDKHKIEINNLIYEKFD